ncbi:MAG: hypothetical protein Q8Q37_01500 [bacterium]|nr:hypothetical protein [bacterium]
MAITRKTFFIILIGIAILVGILYAAPQALIRSDLHKDGKPYVVMQLTHHMDELVQYMPRAREVYDGHFPPSDLSLDKSYPSVFPAIPPLIFSWFIYFFSGDINLAYIAVTGIFSSIIFLLIYAVSYVTTHKRLWSIFISTLSSFAVVFYSLPRVLFSWVGFLNGTLKKFYPLVATPLDRHPLARFDDPLLTAPIFLLALLFLWLLWRDNKRFYAIMSGIFSGLLFYTYLHYWAYLAIVVGCLFLYVITRRCVIPGLFKNILLYIAIVAIVAIPFIINYHNFNKVPDIQDYVGRIGLENTRLPEIGQTIGSEIFLHYALFLLLGFLIYRCWFVADRMRAIFFLSCLAAAFIVWNVQVVTGFVPHPDHWGKPISIMLLIVGGSLVGDFIYRKISSKTLTILLSIGILLLFGKATINVLKFVSPSQDFGEAYTFDRGVVESWKWIDANLSGEPKIVSPSLETSYYLYSYTKARPYLPTAENTMAPNSVLENRYLTANKLFNVPIEVMIAGLHNNDNYRRAFLYYIYYKKHGSDLNQIPDTKIKDLEKTYNELHPQWDFVDAEYAYYGPTEKKISSVDFSQDENLEIVYKNDSVQISKIKK